MHTDTIPEDRAQLERIADFKKGYSEIVEKHNSLVRTCQQLMNSNLLGSDERQKLGGNRNQIENHLSELQKLSRSLTSDINPASLEKEAGREFHNIFNAEISDHRLSFISFLKTYVYLKKFALNCVQHWTDIRSILNSSGMSNSEFKRQLLEYGVTPGIHFCDTIHVYCNRMGILLRLQYDPISSNKLDGAAQYSPQLEYQLSYVFTPNLESHVERVFGDYGTDRSQLPRSDAYTDRGVRKMTAAAETVRSLPDHRLDASGSAEFNRSPHYYFHYDPAALEQERALYKQVVYMDTHMGADQQYIKSDLIITISRKTGLSQKVDIETEYKNFLHAFFTLVTDISMLNLQVDQRFRYLFIFHLGPQTFNTLTIKFLQEVGTGTLHRKVAGGKMIRKYIPRELIKQTIIEWWRSDVLPAVKDTRDDYVMYKRIIARIKEMHARLSRKAMQEFEALPEQIKARRSREDIFREKIPEWMGATNIIIFKRFLKSG